MRQAGWGAPQGARRQLTTTHWIERPIELWLTGSVLLIDSPTPPVVCSTCCKLRGAGRAHAACRLRRLSSSTKRWLYKWRLRLDRLRQQRFVNVSTQLHFGSHAQTNTLPVAGAGKLTLNDSAGINRRIELLDNTDTPSFAVWQRGTLYCLYQGSSQITTRLIVFSWAL